MRESRFLLLTCVILCCFAGLNISVSAVKDTKLYPPAATFPGYAIVNNTYIYIGPQYITASIVFETPTREKCSVFCIVFE